MDLWSLNLKNPEDIDVMCNWIKKEYPDLFSLEKLRNYLTRSKVETSEKDFKTITDNLQFLNNDKFSSDVLKKIFS